MRIDQDLKVAVSILSGVPLPVLMAIASVATVIILVFCYRFITSLFRVDMLGIRGRLVFVDHGAKTKPFFNKSYRILGKPDLMYKRGFNVLLVEYKSRRGKVYESDIEQAKAAALAVRGSGQRVRKVLVKTSSDEVYIRLPSSDRALYNEIRESVDMARRALSGQMVAANGSKAKCRSCAFSQSCRYRHR